MCNDLLKEGGQSCIKSITHTVLVSQRPHCVIERLVISLRHCFSSHHQFSGLMVSSSKKEHQITETD